MLTKLELIQRREEGDDTVYTYNATFGERHFRVEYAEGPENQASGLSIRKLS